jgi:pSer/pThr/pTyr-binding forkhead associated (FHA) protein
MSGTKSQNSTPPVLRVNFKTALGDRELEFSRPFRIGRTDECDVCIPDEYVSRSHAEVVLEGRQWSIRDLHSANGIFLDGQRVETTLIDGPITIRLGVEGPFVSFIVEPTPAVTPEIGSETMARYINRYFVKPSDGEQVGEHTIMVRRAFAQVHRKQRSKYTVALAVLAVAVLAASGYALHERQVAVKQKAFAEDIFYNMKSLDVDIANVEKLVLESNNRQGMDEVKKYQSRRKEMEKSYDKFLTTLRVYDPKMTPQQQLVLRVARIFGECELAMPPAFMTEINNYIAKWQSSDRLRDAIANANAKGYTARISEELLAQDLPPQFFYLALQESNFDPYISGPETAKGIAKGMWQFIPETAVKYGLQIGPLVDMRRADTRDDRHHWDRETIAAAKYLKDLYSTDAQASDLLVMACYNWGEGRVIPLVRSMPPNPRDRNFWRLLSLYRDKIPQETYDYVFYIVSAAVIGENPRLFGFDFDNPLAQPERK